MRGHRWIKVALLLPVLAAFVVAPTAAAKPPSHPTKPPARPTEIRLIWVKTSDRTSGTRGSWTSRLENQIPQFGQPAGATVGRELGFTFGSRASGAITLPGGVLQFGGPVMHLAGGRVLRLPITEGFGVFAGVTGTYTLTWIDGAHPRNATLVLRLRYRRT